MSYGDRPAAVRALEGATVLFMVSGAESADRLEQHRTFVDAAVDAGVEHIVYTSFYGAAADCTFTLGRDHWATEEHIKAAGLSYTFLRDNFYLDVLPLFAGREGVLRGPAGEGRVSAVARADIARVAVAVLRDPPAHRNATYHLTGPEALTMTEVAHTITAVTGRPVTSTTRPSTRPSVPPPMARTAMAVRRLGVDLSRHRPWRGRWHHR